MDKNKGFSLLEIIITLTIAAVLMTGFVSIMSYIRLANTRKCVEELDTLMEKVKLRTMSSAQKPYLYLYKETDGYYVVVSTSAVFTSDLKKNASLLAGSSTTMAVTANGTAEAIQSPVCISFSRGSGAFESPYNEIVVGGRKTTKIIMIKSTGKHYIE